MKKILAILICLSFFGFASANDIIQKSDKIVPRWVKHTPKSENPNIAYRVVQVYVDNLADAHTKSIEELANYLPQTWDVSRYADWQVNNNGSNEIKVLMEGSAVPVPMNCKEIDSYWEYVRVGNESKYLCYVLYKIVRPGERAVEFTRLTDKYGWEPVVLSIIPGAGQMYKGTYLKGGMILGASVICAGGIIFCETNRAGYMALANKEHSASTKKNYVTQANNWAVGNYACIGALAGIWIYNIIDAAIAPGARRMVVDNKFKNFSFKIAPTMYDAYTPAVMAQISF